MKCKSCGYEFGPKFSAKFCPECGTSANFGNDKIRCIKCSYEMDSNLKYCPECGEPKPISNDKKGNEDRNRRDRDRRDRDRGGDDDDDEGGILGGIGDFVGKLFGG